MTGGEGSGGGGGEDDGVALPERKYSYRLGNDVSAQRAANSGRKGRREGENKKEGRRGGREENLAETFVHPGPRGACLSS